jgi:hypothetical protein
MRDFAEPRDNAGDSVQGGCFLFRFSPLRGCVVNVQRQRSSIAAGIT